MLVFVSDILSIFIIKVDIIAHVFIFVLILRRVVNRIGGSEDLIYGVHAYVLVLNVVILVGIVFKHLHKLQIGVLFRLGGTTQLKIELANFLRCGLG